MCGVLLARLEACVRKFVEDQSLAFVLETHEAHDWAVLLCVI